MKILIANDSKIPAIKYGGTERVMWGLGKCLSDMGHEVTFLVAAGSSCPFAKVIEWDKSKDLNSLIPDDIDVVHLNFQPTTPINKPYIATFHGNLNHVFEFDLNTVFISGNQAKRFHGCTFVYNGLDWSNYEKPDLNNLKNKRDYFHFLGDASWKVKNVKGAIAITKKAHEKLAVLGGYRLNFNMGFRFTPDLHVSFKGMVDDAKKRQYLQYSKGLIFPVLWHEPFGLAIIESLFYGCPAFGSAYGSLPELIVKEVGVTSNSYQELINELKNVDRFSNTYCHEYASDNFNSIVMTKKYIALYEKVLNGETIHQQKPYFTKNDIIPVKRLPMNP